MKPVNFPQANCTFAKDQPQYLQLFAERDQVGDVTACWGKATLRERIKFLFTGKIWLKQQTFGLKLQPQWVSVDSPYAEPVTE